MWIDIAWLGLAVLGMYKGWRQGLIISIFTVLAWVLGIVGALKFCAEASVVLRDRAGLDSPYVPVLAFLAVFILIAFIIYLTGRSLEKVVEIAQLGTMNKILGVVLRVSLYTLLFSLFIWLIHQAGFVTPAVKSASRSFDILLYLADLSIATASAWVPSIQPLFKDIESFFEELAGSAATDV